ncbi:S-layer homology domain-containing protein [Sporomusa termitida]|uniref:S-layer homology domain protein n=1 Tax=Sporomusa termitida TaxID=2377 RepID=A0A517E1K1_9FIRM|nr:S-layer homology domain-containing protein [Sporomusa termitida]QDR83484.1 S-layer homology domain protein [Sporomusa termitida]
MKKTLVTLLAPVFILSSGATALAAPANPFVDVPAKHWAYDAVAILAKTGIVDGYGDGTFRGDRNMTRYEMAEIIDKAIAKADQADAVSKALIDKLAVEFEAELNSLGVRVAKVEAKQNVWIGGETRLRWVTNSPASETGNAKLHGSDNFEFRQRLKFWGTVNDNVSWYGRLTTVGGNKFGAYEGISNSGSAVGIDLFAITAKNFLGIDSLRVGRFPLDSVGHGILGKAIGVDGFRLDQQFGPNVTFTGAVNNVKWNANAITNAAGNPGVSVPIDGTGLPGSGDARTLTNGQLAFKLTDNFGMKAGYYWADIPGGRTTMNVAASYPVTMFDRSQGWIVGFNAKVGDYKLFGDYMSTTLDNNVASGPFAISSNPKGWFLQLTNSKVSPYVIYGAANLVNPVQVGTDAWMVSYRSLDAGVSPSGAGGWDTGTVAYATQLNAFTKASDNVKCLSLAYQKVIAKNVLMSLEYADFKLKNKTLAGLNSDSLDKNTQVKFEFFY